MTWLSYGREYCSGGLGPRRSFLAAGRQRCPGRVVLPARRTIYLNRMRTRGLVRLWVLYRIVRGWTALGARKAMPAWPACAQTLGAHAKNRQRRVFVCG